MLRVAYIASPTRADKPKRLTAQQKLHIEAVASLAARRIHDREKANKMFAPEIAELELEEKKYGICYNDKVQKQKNGF